MQRELALRRALERARDRRRDELVDVEARSGEVRRRLRLLTDSLSAVEHVHGRFKAPPPAEPQPERAPEPAEPQAPETPKPAETPEQRILAPMPKHEETHAELLTALSRRHPEGFTVSELLKVLEETDPRRPHSYDSAWALTNRLHRSRILELAGSRPGPRTPIRVFRVKDRATDPPERTAPEVA